MFKKTKNFIVKFKKIIIGLFITTALAAGLSGVPQDFFNNLNVKVYTVCNLQEARRISIATDLQTFKTRNPDNSLRELDANERASFKSCEIAKRGTEFAGIYTSTQYGTRIEIIGEVKAIEINGQHGIELFAKAWKGNQQLGFSKDGSVDIERFRIFNPPILVDDPNGTIIREWTDDITGQIVKRKLREDLLEATRQVIAHNAKLVGKENAPIVIGKVGNTTSTFYPDTGDAYIQNSGVDTWANIHNAATGNAISTQADFGAVAARRTGGNDYWISSVFQTYTTSAIGTDNIDSATLSIKGNTNSSIGLSYEFNVFNSTHTDVPVIEDYDLRGATAWSNSTILITNWSTSAFNDWVFNSSGLAGINKTGKTKLAIRETTKDVANVAPTVDGNKYIVGYQSLEALTTSDPKLVVVHSVEAATGEEYIILFE